MDIVQIMKILPHRYPFLLVDRVKKMERPQGANRVGYKIWASKNVTYNEPHFVGHFPHLPLMPGVLQIEAMAQVAALAVIDPSGPPIEMRIAGIDKARFRRPVMPGDVLDLHAEVLKDRGQILVIRCQAEVNGQLAAEAEILAKMFFVDSNSDSDSRNK